MQTVETQGTGEVWKGLKMKATILLILLSGCSALDAATNQSFDSVDCTIEMCADDEICVVVNNKPACHLKCATDDECAPGEGCLPTSEGALMCFDESDYHAKVPNK